MSTLPKLNSVSEELLSIIPNDIDYSSINIEDLRKNHTAITLSDEIPRPDVTVQRIKVPTCKDNHLIPVDVYRPASPISDKILPAMVFLPGGGFCLPAHGGHPFLATKIAGDTNCVVLLAHYSLSPEAKYPTATEECYSVFEWITNPKNASTLFIDPTRIAMGGDSAGAALTISTALLAKKRGLENKMVYQVLYYPPIYATSETESRQQFTENCILTKDVIDFFMGNYLSDEKDKLDPICFPVNNTIEDLMGLPPTLVITAEADPLRDGKIYKSSYKGNS